MANEVLVKQGLQFLFADVTDFPNSGAGPPTTAANSLILGGATKVQIDCTNLAAAGGSRESDKFDFTTPWGNRWSLDACIEFASAPTDGTMVDFWIGASPSGTAGTGNPGSLTGADAAYTETSGKLGQLIYVGSLSLENDVICIGHVGIFTPFFQYGILVMENNGNTGFHATLMDEVHITLTELIDEVQ